MEKEKENQSLGKVVYSVDGDQGKTSEKIADKDAEKDVEEADKESFPASDAPGFGGRTIEPDR